MIVDRIGLNAPAVEAAQNLLGCELVRQTPEGTSRVRIVETEAYSEDDPASHSYNGPTPRSRVMFGPAGQWYVYKCYGIHWMLNVVTGEPDNGEATLIRAGKPVEGEELMEQRRGLEGIELTNGPGKLAEALAVDDRFDGRSVRDSDLRLEPAERDEPIFESPRVGIEDGQNRHWRFYYDSNYCSDVSQNDLGRRRNRSS